MRRVLQYDSIRQRQAGYELKQVIMRHLEERGLSYKDYGSYSPDPVDYPVYGKKVAHAIVDGECDKGILICGTGIGISIAANKVPGIRAAVCSDCFSAEATRLHNDANIFSFRCESCGTGTCRKNCRYLFRHRIFRRGKT